MSALDVDLVCTHDDLVAEVHSVSALQDLLPRDARGDSRAIRAKVYDDVLRALARRSPPVREADLSDPRELCPAVVRGTMMCLYRASITTATDDDVHFAKWKMYRDDYDSELGGLAPTVEGGAIGTPLSFDLGRR